MRRWMLIARVALVGVVGALVVASDGAAGLKYLTVTLTSSGPSPSAVQRPAFSGVSLTFANSDAVPHTVVFASGCSFTVSPGGTGGCPEAGPNRRGTYHYMVDGTFSGTVRVVGLFRAVTVTARTHSIKLGRSIKLHGVVTMANQGAPFCTPSLSRPVVVLARHNRNQPFKRIAMFPGRGRSHSKSAVDNRCTYTWQREVRPELSTTYIAKTFGGLYLYRPATSRPFTVMVRH